MTTIATDGVTIAADTQSLFGEERAQERAEKITVRGGFIFGMAGVAGMRDAVISWYLEGHDPKEAPPTFKSAGWSLLVVENDGTLHYCTDECPYVVKVAPPFSIGAGEKYATTAMHCGKTPAEAIALTIKLTTTSGGEVDEIDIASALAQPTLAMAAE